MKINSLVLSLILFAIAPLAAAEMVVVTRAGSALSSLSEHDVKRLYLGETKTVNGVAVTILDRSRESEVYEQFYQKILNRSPAQMRSHWARLTFTGRASPPKSVGSAESVRALFATGDDNYVVYMDSGELSANMTVLYTLR